MTSATSYFNKTVLKKDLTRFAPVWILTTIFLSIILPNTIPYHIPENIPDWLDSGAVSMMAIANLVYGFLCAALLFGDLFVQRLCYSLHTMPLRREGWFLTHALSGLLFMLIPYSTVSVVCMFRLGSYWNLALMWLLYNVLQYLFFFGLSTLCVMISGNRTGMFLIYAVLNSLSMLVYSFINTLYMPMLRGLILSEKPFLLFCPLLQIFAVQQTPQLPVTMWILGGLGIVLLIGALLLYRRRDLETAGDFIAFSGVKPVFLLIYSLAFSLVFFLMCQVFIPISGIPGYWSLIPGLILGYFTGQMLITRSLRVFSSRKIIRCIILLVLVLASLLITHLDPMGLVSRQPAPRKVVSISCSGTYSAFYSDQFHSNVEASARVIGALPSDGTDWNKEGDYAPTVYTTSDPQEMEELRRLHASIVRNTEHVSQNVSRRTFPFYISYQLSDGSFVERRYMLSEDAPEIEQVRHFLSRPAFILGYTDWQAFADAVTEINWYSWERGEDVPVAVRDPGKIRAVLEAIKEDCEAGRLSRPCELTLARGGSVSNPSTWSIDTIILQLQGIPGAPCRAIEVPSNLLQRYLNLIN